ncbi:unnamed protein product, partial [Enterobius vermicularis]|uniref:PID domain-containing protein n=1 Tax=Enterobius vermicularis TaxID=51028 RepID=A0A0N4USK2_ENTVE
MNLYNQDDSSGISSCCTGSEHQTSTHRVHSPFIPRHDDEVLNKYLSFFLLILGTNLRTGQQGIFPVAHVCEIDFPYDTVYQLSSSNLPIFQRDTFYLTMLASIEVAHHKGNDVLVQAMNKVLSLYKNKEEFVVPVTVVMEISFRGIHIIDKSKKNIFQCPNFDFFYSLQNISFCGAHPKQLRYFGFITKHPILPRFACHVFLSSKSTQVIVEAIGF